MLSKQCIHLIHVCWTRHIIKAEGHPQGLEYDTPGVDNEDGGGDCGD